ncbi:hypothetical protein AWN76_013835 [Rhodothermaceae bacterium RA]|nr:hypothetical protein AWN76_013835 [Rhodothermaceae bacterium RA]
MKTSNPMRVVCYGWIAGLLLMAVLAGSVRAQWRLDRVTVYPKEEFRGAWIATVNNLDWPRTTSTSAQQAELVALLDGLKAAGINAVFFQIRPACDAFYASSYEPWSAWLTGTQGQPPEPFYDPLAFAIEEAHKRGMELHAWFNPFRAVIGSAPLADTHIAETHPEWILEFDGLEILNPGIPDVRSYIADVIMDVVTRYDVDGVHYDDYFYPYPPNQITNEDQETYATYGGGFASIDTWRRYNINMFVRTVHERLTAFEAETGRVVKHGVSPFGIWKSGVPSGINGLSAYDVIYADAPNWLAQEWIDYLVPQLYWPFGGGQDYGKLAPWWATQMNGRHLYPGHGLYRADRNTYGGTLFAADEVPRQVRFNRAQDGIHGSVFFRALNLTRYSSRGFADSLRTDLYRYPAIPPSMAWKDLTPPPAPDALTFTWTADDEVTLDWAPLPAKTGQAAPWRYAVYRVRSSTPPDVATVQQDARNLLAVTGGTSLTDRPGLADEPYYYFVTALSGNSVESEPSPLVSVEGRAVSTEPVTLPVAFVLEPNYPNPFNPSTEIRFTLARSASVTLTVYDALGREVARLVDGQHLAAGPYAVRWDGTDAHGRPVSSGTYFYQLTDGTHRQTRSMVLVK